MLKRIANKSNAVATRRLFLFLLGRQREHHVDDDTESDREDDSMGLSSSDSEIDNTEATDTELELLEDSVCEVDGISSLFDEHRVSDLSEDNKSEGGDDNIELSSDG